MPMLHFDLDELLEDLISEEKSKNQNSTDTTHKEKNGGIGGEVPQAQQPQGFATPPNNSTESTNSTTLVEKHTLEEHLSDLTEEEEALIDSLLSWVSTCLPGEEWTMPLDWLPDSDELRMAAEEEVRKRNPALRIWRTGKDKLVCKAWFGPEPEPPQTRNRNTSSYFRNHHGKRIDTMWSEAEGWCRWDTLKHGYVPDKKNHEKLKGTGDSN